ncbi:MAG TPA: family 16 glycoside hydrolase [Chryseolinea sp.]|nr:family 16 glycoside hydrolase [Chryseolinea sp.]
MKGRLFLPLAFACTFAFGQQPSSVTLPLTDLSAFRSQAGNWQIVGDVTIDPTRDIHEHAAAPALSASKKKNKKGAAIPTTVLPIVSFSPGAGILLNLNDETKKDHLVSVFEHGDIELEFEVMLPKGSNSGVYLQGRYEVQLLDSWGVKNPSFSDIGGIYRNWEKEEGKIYMGKAPLTNSAKAPGLWQKFKVAFRAPRFNSAGEKIANARFVSVELNGVKIHDNVEVPLPTGGPLENNELPIGPLMIQGDHGPVAIRNVKYKLMKEVSFSLSEITYKTWYGDFKAFSDFTSLAPAATGSIPELTCEVLENEDAYGVQYAGKINVPEDGSYAFTLAFSGGGRLTINNEQVTNFPRRDGYEQNKGWITLKKGSNPFEILNYKNASWMPPRLGLFVSSETTYQQSLHAFNSYPPDDDPTSPIFVAVGNEPKLLRSFLDFNGDRRQRLTHTISVGDPSGVNYVYDNKNGNLLCAWHGAFVDATRMWHDRGDGSSVPRGAAQYFFVNQPLAFLATDKDAFPVIPNDALTDKANHVGKGYSIGADGRPVFKYNYQGLEVEDKIYPDGEGKALTHEVIVKNRGTKAGLYYKLGEGHEITALKDGLYAIDDKQYFIRIESTKVVIREVNGRKELIVPVDTQVKYDILW